MQPDLYLRFARYILGDLAERGDQTGEKPRRGDRRYKVVAGIEHRIPLRGDHIQYVGEERFRGSDRAFRLTLAVTAYERCLSTPELAARGLLQRACEGVAYVVLHQLVDVQPERLARVGEVPSGFRMRLSLLARRRGRKPKPLRGTPPTPRFADRPAVQRPAIQAEYRDPYFVELDRLIAENDSAPALGKQRHKPNAEVLRLAEVIRVQVGKYRKEHVNWEQQFNGWIGSIQSDHGRDDEWYKQAELVYTQRIETAMLHPSEFDVAMAILSLGHLYHEQSKFVKAATQYKRALKVYAAASVPEAIRAVMVPWCKAQIARCKLCQGPEAAPAMRLDSPAHRA